MDHGKGSPGLALALRLPLMPATNLKKAPHCIRVGTYGRGRGRRADSDERREPETEKRDEAEAEAGRRIRRGDGPGCSSPWVTVAMGANRSATL